jgi:transposase
LGCGHQVKLIAAQFVKPFVKGNKTDRNEAEGDLRALRPGMRFVALKTVEQQQTLALHRVRSGAVKTRTALANQTRGLLTEVGLIAPKELHKLLQQLPELLDDVSNNLPHLLRQELRIQLRRLRELNLEVLRLIERIEQAAKTDERSLDLMQRRGVGPLTRVLSPPHLVMHTHSRMGARLLLGWA